MVRIPTTRDLPVRTFHGVDMRPLAVRLAQLVEEIAGRGKGGCDRFENPLDEGEGAER